MSVDATTQTGTFENRRRVFDLEAVVAYYATHSLDDTCKEFGTVPKTLRKHFREAGVEMRVRGNRLTKRAGEIDWQDVVLPRAVEILAGYSTPVTLRQLYYRLVSEQLIPNTQNAYQVFSKTSAEWRRLGTFPDLLDTTRDIEVERGWDSPEEAREYLRRVYLRDRSEGQESALYLVCEKRGQSAQLRSWFGEERSIPVVCLGGFASQTLIHKLRADFDYERTVRILYAGDFDCTGEEIEEDFKRRLNIAGLEWWYTFERVVLSREQVDEYELPENPGKDKDSNAGKFKAKYGTNVQVELDALDPLVLRQLFADAIDPYWDEDVAAGVLEREAEERETL